VVGGDTGPVHLATALGTPVIALFGPTDPARNGPYHVAEPAEDDIAPSRDTKASVNSKNKLSARDVVFRAPNVVTTHKRSEITHSSMLEIQVDAVFDAVKRTVQARE
jgi:ADP-heptose:LPS heptosyltransferase